MLDEHSFFRKLEKDGICRITQWRYKSFCESTARSILNGGSCIHAPKDLESKAYNLEIIMNKIANLFHGMYLNGLLNVSDDID